MIPAAANAWIDLARHAPSGDNSQPWQVALAARDDGFTLALWLDDATTAQPSLFDCGFVASFISLGAFAQNFALLAAANGYAARDAAADSGRFTLDFRSAPAAPASGREADIAALIRRRTTNRLPFKKDRLPENARAALQDAASAVAGPPSLREFTGETQARLARLFFALDRIRYRNARLYREFLDRLRFGAEATRSLDGLRDITLGVPPPSIGFLRLLRALRDVRLARAPFFLGLDRVMSSLGCLHLIRRSAAVLTLASPDDTPLGWFRLGRAFQNLWLEATRQNLSLQPLGTTLLLYRHEREQREAAPLSFALGERSALAALSLRFRTEFGIDLRQPCLACRIGRADPIENNSLRRPVRLNASL